jgi:hypothetical protein
VEVPEEATRDGWHLKGPEEMLRSYSGRVSTDLASFPKPLDGSRLGSPFTRSRGGALDDALQNVTATEKSPRPRPFL